MQLHTSLQAGLIGLAIAGAAHAQVAVNTDITTSTTWTAGNTYQLFGQIYVRNGATLTIEAGTVIYSPTGAEGSLAVARGSQIFVNGTEERPVVFTSQNDIATWAPLAGHPTGKNPKTGTWRPASNEWGNLTIMGRGFISICNTAGYQGAFSPNNVADMEGLVAQVALPGINQYGGGDDNDDSGTIRYCSLRYGGKVIGLGNELNGISLGGVGRGTDIDHVEIMNGIDDGFEIWGGTVSPRYVSIWNIGDDSFDIDQGWRGTAQFGLIVQGYSVTPGTGNQGSGVGDNLFETDGAEDPAHEPVTRAAICNFTVIGQPDNLVGSSSGGDHATAWRDNARLQYRNCIFMDIGGNLIAFDNASDGCGTGYTVPFNPLWTTPAVVAAPNYTAYQGMGGNECQISDSVFYNIAGRSLAETLRVMDGPAGANLYNNVDEPFTMPITSIARETPAQTMGGGDVFARVTSLDPRPQADALTSVSFAPNGTFEPVDFRGGFRPGVSWLGEWTASYAYGITPSNNYMDLGFASSTTGAAPSLRATGDFTTGGATVTYTATNAATLNVLAFSFNAFPGGLPVFGGTLVPNTVVGGTAFIVIGTNTFSIGPIPTPANWALGTTFYAQWGAVTTAPAFSVGFSNAVKYTVN